MERILGEFESSASNCVDLRERKLEKQRSELKRNVKGI